MEKCAICDYFGDIDYQKLKSKKQIFVYGMGVFGISILQVLIDNKIYLKGIIDKRANVYSQVLGVDVYSSEILKNLNPIDCYIIVAATKPQSIHEITKLLVDKFDFIVLNNKQTVQIDISGVCNLKCKSCPVGNSTTGTFSLKGRKFMLPEMFENIIEKIRRELPDNKCVNLYIYGDPLLSPYLPEVLRILNKYHLIGILSTNLSMRIDLEPILMENPSCIKISTSGYTQDIYKTTHNNGDIRLVKSNMYMMRYLIDKYHLTTNVIVGYHVYKNNNNEEYEQMKRLCEELSFMFQPTSAMYFNNFKKMGLEEFESNDIEFINEYYSNSDEILKVLPRTEGKRLECGLLRDGLFIDWDGKAMLCCTLRRDDAILPYNYLDTPLKVIQEARFKHYICKECAAHNLEWE